MNTKHVLLCALLVTVQSAFGFNSKPNVKTQLEELNTYWKTQDLDYPILESDLVLNDEVTLIQTHLSLVEMTLRNKSTAQLSAAQRSNRLKCLDILHQYWKKGSFPKNTFHATRTPYFIDIYGTACAVGQLIISTGYGAFAQKVKAENNNGYIMELNAEYPELSAWAKEFGFSLQELAWIQPCYCTMSGAGKKDVSCSGGHDGYWMPDMSSLPTPIKSMEFYRWTGTDWGPDWYSSFIWCGPCSLTAGDYKMIVTDATNKAHNYFATLNEPAEPSIQVTISGNGADCNATAMVSVSGGFPPYTYNWSVGSATNTSISGLCIADYQVYVQDSKPCFYYKPFSVGYINTTGISETSFEKPRIFPNPFSSSLRLNTGSFFQAGNTTVTIHDALGRQCAQFKMNANEELLPLNDLEHGVYTLKIHNGQKTAFLSVIKE